MNIYFINGVVPYIVARSQKELDSIPISWNGSIEIRFETVDDPCVITQSRAVAYIVRGNSFVEAHNGVAVIARDNSHVTARGNSTIEAYNNSYVSAHDNSTVNANHSSVVDAYDNAMIHNHGNCGRICFYSDWQHAVNHHFTHTEKSYNDIGVVLYQESRYGDPHIERFIWH